MPETLHTCPRCGRANFTTRGLKAHVCRPERGPGPRSASPAVLPQGETARDGGTAASPERSPTASMPKTTSLAVVHSDKPIDLEKLDAVQIRNSSFVFATAELTRRGKAMLANMDSLKTERAMKAILTGIFFKQSKIQLGHGAFEAWTKENFAQSKRTIEYYMKLALVFSRSAKLMLPELAGTNQLALDLEAPTSEASTVKAKLEKFVGARGVTELLKKHRILKRGGKKTPHDDGEDGDEQDDVTPEQAAAAAYDTAYAAIEAASKTMLSDLVWTDLSIDGAAKIEAKIAELETAFHQRLLKSRFEARA